MTAVPPDAARPTDPTPNAAIPTSGSPGAAPPSAGTPTATPGAGSSTGEDPLAPYDTILLLSFGGPESPDEVLPFLRRVTAGRGIPDERLEEVGAHYALFGGRSPINDECRALMTALRAELARREIATPVVWGNRNGEPFLADALREATAAGARRIVSVVTSAYSSYSSCRQYRENLGDAVADLADESDIAGAALQVDKVAPYALTPGFAAATVDLVRSAIARLPASADPRLLFVTHSIPTAMDDTSGPGDGEGNAYVDEHLRVARLVADTVGVEGELVFCSRSGPPTQPWLEPDINDRLEELAAEGTKTVIVVPIGFIADHMEVVYDLDTEARATAQRLGMTLVRVPTVRTHPAFVGGLVDLLLERAVEARGEGVARPASDGGTRPPSVCAEGCCPNLRAARLALCGAGRW
jgi:ferrochelatase